MIKSNALLVILFWIFLFTVPASQAQTCEVCKKKILVGNRCLKHIGMKRCIKCKQWFRGFSKLCPKCRGTSHCLVCGRKCSGAFCFRHEGYGRCSKCGKWFRSWYVKSLCPECRKKAKLKKEPVQGHKPGIVDKMLNPFKATITKAEISSIVKGIYMKIVFKYYNSVPRMSQKKWRNLIRQISSSANSKRDVAKDLWHHYFIVSQVRRKFSDAMQYGFEVRSAGPDGRLKTKDDIFASQWVSTVDK